MSTLLTNFYNICEKNKIKITPQRIEIFKELIKNNDHPSVTKIYQRVKKKYPNISFDTVNRTLQKFVEIGIARVVEDFEDFRRYDGFIENHHHFHCIKCHRIIDIYDEKFKEVEIPKTLRDRFNILESKIVFTGLCEKCKPDE
ncbi:MAG: Fur family transcriptional regulator [Thermodesulfovibrio sp.]|nr:Fur family transcriptional regulator [Thermodesulfovibrio sp.]